MNSVQKLLDFIYNFPFVFACMSLTPGQVSESDMWSSELAHRLWGEEETGGSCPAAWRRSRSFQVYCSDPHYQLLRRAWLDHWFCSKKGWTWFGYKVEGKNIYVLQMWLWRASLGILALPLLNFWILLDVFMCQEEELKRKKREERLEMIRNNVQLKYAIKRKVSDLGQWPF